MSTAPPPHLTAQAKVQMLDNLLDIEVAYSLLRGGAQDNENDPIDINYEKLKTKIEVRSRRLLLCEGTYANVVVCCSAGH